MRAFRDTAVLLIVGLLMAVGHPLRANAWGSAGHRIVAYIAADNLTPPARRAVAKILGVPDRSRSVARAMADASVLPDTAFRDRDPATISWHFINICLQDGRSTLAARCVNGHCVTAKINEYAARLREANYDRWGASGDLAFLIHFVGDVYQPLHAANDADQGGNCIRVSSPMHVSNLHSFWDVTLVKREERALDSGSPRRTAHILERLYRDERNNTRWNANTAGDIAWQSTMLARSQIYAALDIPVEPCEPEIHSCRNAPDIVLRLSSAYIRREGKVAGEQLAKAGFALAQLLNDTWQ